MLTKHSNIINGNNNSKALNEAQYDSQYT